MKRIVISLMILLGCMCAPVGAFSMYQELYGGITPQYQLSDDDAAQGYCIDFYIEYSFDYIPGENENMVLEFEGGPSFTLMKTEADHESMNVFGFYAEPEFEWTIIDLVSLSEVVGLYYLNEKIVEEDGATTRESGFDVTSDTTLMIGNFEEDIPGVSPWEEFMNGFKIETVYMRHLYSKYGDETADELDHAISAGALYAMFNQDTAFMFAPSAVVVKHLNDAVDESLALGGQVEIAKDFTEALTLDAVIGFVNNKPDSDTDAENELAFNLDVILNLIEKLEVTFNGNYWNNLSNDEIVPIIGIGVDLNYEIWMTE